VSDTQSVYCSCTLAQQQPPQPPAGHLNTTDARLWLRCCGTERAAMWV
jgi:hypothetical protein